MYRHILQRLLYLCLALFLIIALLPPKALALENSALSTNHLPQDGLFPTAGDYDQTMMSDGIERRYLVHIPDSYDPATPTPLLLSFHGYLDTPDNNAQYTRLIPKSDAEGFIVVFPQGQGDEPAWYAYTGATREWADDLLFIRELIEKLQSELNIDPQRIFATGMSNGGGMTGRVGCELSDIVAAIAPVSANHVYNDPCHPRRPVPVFAIHGRADEVTPFEGLSTILANIPEWTAHWVANNACDSDPILSSKTYVADVADFETEVTIETYTNCADDAEVILNIYEDMGHAWPAASAPDDMWAFFEAHPLPAHYLDGVPELASESDSDDENTANFQIPPGDYVGIVNSSAGQRDYYWHIPVSYTGDTPVPLVISFHDFDSDPVSHATLTGWREKSDDEGFIVVFPAGSGNPLRFNIRADIPEGAPDDVQIIRDLIDSLHLRANIDPDRIYVTGFSLGGGMAHRIACELTDQIAGLATVAGGYFVDDPCEASRPIPVISFVSRDDEVVPFGGNDILMAFGDWRFIWLAANNCALEPGVTERDGLTITQYERCTDDTWVVSYIYDSVGHSYPPTAVDNIWSFFELFADEE